MNHIKKFDIIFSFILLVFFILILKDFDFSEFYTFYNKIPLYFWIIFFFLFIITYFLKGLRFYYLNDKSITPIQFYFISVTHNFFLVMLPFRSGELIYLKKLKDLNIKFSKSTSDLIIVRFYDFLALLFITLFFLAQYLLLINKNVIILLILFIVVFFFALVYKKNLQLRYSNLLNKYNSKKNNLIYKFFNFLLEVVQHFDKLSLSKNLKLFFLSIFIWIASFLPWIIIFNFTTELSLSKSLIVIIIALLAIFIPINPPAGIGIVEGGWIAGLMIVGIDYSSSVTLSIFLHLIILLYTASVYYLTVIIPRLFNFLTIDY